MLRYADAAALVTDARLVTQDAAAYRRMGAPVSLVTFADEGLLVAMSGDKHSRIRRVFSAAFRVTTIESARSRIRAIASDLVASLPPGGSDLVREFTNPYPMRVLCTLLGVPLDDVALFEQAASDLHLLAAIPLDPGFPLVDRALRDLTDYIGGLVALRQSHPTDDVISSLIAAQETHGRLSENELIYNLVNLIFAGQVTTRYQLASTIRAMVEVPGLWEQVADDPETAQAVVEEALRFYPVTRFLIRLPQEDLTIGNLRVRKGRRVVLNLLAASRDPDRFPQPDRFILRPQGERFEIPFGWGMHHCLGAALVRVEIQEAIRVMTAALTDVSIGQPMDFTPPGDMLYGPEHMGFHYRRRTTAAAQGLQSNVGSSIVDN